jgi:hypothetical protein
MIIDSEFLRAQEYCDNRIRRILVDLLLGPVPTIKLLPMCHSEESTRARLERIHRTTISLAVKAIRAKADLFARLERQCRGMVDENGLTFTFFPNPLPIELKGIAV